jgi:Glycosyl transferases group 1
VSYGTVVDFEDAMRERTDSDLVHVPSYSRRRRLRSAVTPKDQTFAPVPTPREKYDLCFFVAMEPSWISSLHYVERLREKCSRIVVYIFDSWLANAHWLKRNRRAWSFCDLVYVSFPWTVDAYARRLSCPVEYLPQAARASRFHSSRQERPIDILSIGRRLAEGHSLIREISRRHDLFYYYSESDAPLAINLIESQELLSRLCQSARSQACWPVELTNPERSREGSAITARWFEAASCGSVVVGARPRAEEFSEIFPYDRFVLEMNLERPDEFERGLLSLFDDRADWEARRELSEFVRSHHSWEARCDKILGESFSR